MQTKYTDEIKQSIQQTIIYDNNWHNISLEQVNSDIHTKTKVIDNDTVSTIFHLRNQFPDKKICALNFADYYIPGGLFLDGIIAQEEDLCHASTLYNVISNFVNYYQYNQKHSNNELYENRALYSPNILFVDEFDEKNIIHADILTCAAPNKYAISEQDVFDQNHDALYSRIRFILEIMKENKVELGILGAFGCGVFMQDAEEVAEIFAELIPLLFADSNIELIFSVPDEHSYNHIAFKEKLSS